MTSPKPFQFTLALVLAVLEVATAAAVSIYFAYGLVTNQANDFVVLLSIVVLMVATTWFLTMATIALSKFKRWGRSALIFWQFLQVTLGWGSIEGQGGILWLGIAIFAVSGTTAILLFSKPMARLFEEE